MTIIVQGMDIPEGCFVCPLKKFNSDDLNYYCPYIKDKAKVSSYFPGTRRHPDCPCKEVPTPHGQLKDVDALIKEIADLEKSPWYNSENRVLYKDAIDIIKHACIMEAPTIIEAEEG